MKKFILLLLMLVGGCTKYNDPTVMANNKARLSQNGEYVGTLPDGRKVVRYCIEMGDAIGNHWIYVTEGSTTSISTQNRG